MAYDASDNSVTSVPASVVVQNGDTTLPVVAVTQPVNGGTVARKSKVSITATVSDNSGVTRVDFSIDREAHVNLAIYDVSGRCIRTLLHTSLPVGSHNATWDGRDDGGDLVASGIYTIVLTSGGRDLRQKCVFLK